MKIALAVLAVLIILAAIALLPLPIRAYGDFQVIYHADMGLLRGIPLYDHAGQVNMIAELAQVPASQVFVLPFPYPPWYALATVWLALFPIAVAARFWFGLNLIMLFLSLWLLTRGVPVARRSLTLILGILWLPVLGSLFVGQYGFPVLLGAALMVHALQRENVPLAACAAVLLTFKPHLGGLILVLTLVYLLMTKSAFARRLIAAVLVAAALLFALGFLVSPLWPLDYFHSLTAFSGVSQCHQCVSVPMALAGLIGGGLDQALWIAIVVALALLRWVVQKWRRIKTGAGSELVMMGALLTLIMSPYLQNYDYLLLLVPFIALARDAERTDWLWLGLAYALPPVSVALFGREGNASLVLSALILFALAAVRLPPESADSSDESRPVSALA